MLILIPAWKPDARLTRLVQGLAQSGFCAVMVVDDGSPDAFASIFSSLQSTGVHVLRHEVNRGKGCALKTGIKLVLQTMPDIEAVITADADGQHAVADIVRMAHAIGNQGHVVLGVRSFTGNVPLRCNLGNAATRNLFRALTGVSLVDTQTGLRGIPRALLPELLHLPGKRYEYEIVQLAHLCRTSRTPLEVPIETLYFNHNRSSHFKPFRDSVRIVYALMRAVVSSKLY